MLPLNLSVGFSSESGGRKEGDVMVMIFRRRSRDDGRGGGLAMKRKIFPGPVLHFSSCLFPTLFHLRIGVFFWYPICSTMSLFLSNNEDRIKGWLLGWGPLVW